MTGRKSENLITDNFTTVSYFSNIKVILISLTVTEYEFISQFSRHVTKAKGEATPRLLLKTIDIGICQQTIALQFE